MALLQISEPGKQLDPHDKKFVVGIDLGTTNSLISVFRNGSVDILKDIDNESKIPSIVNYYKDKITVGKQEKGGNCYSFKSIKRIIGKGKSDIKNIQFSCDSDIGGDDQIIRFDINGDSITPIEISSEILKKLKKIAEDNLGEEVNDCVITVPAYFDDAQRQATKDAAKLANFNVLRLINEPTAAAIAYGLNKEDNHNIAVYDLGGGTFDISILKITKGIFKVLSTGGDTNLGGDDFDYELSKYVSTKIDYEIDSNNKEYLYEISKVKELLSKNESIEYKFEQFPHFPLLKINRDEFNKLIKSYIDKTLTTIKQALEDAELHSSEIDEIIMVGGSTRIPFVRDEISKFFNKKVLTNLNPDEAVVIGAGLQASSFFQKDTDFLLLDVIPLSLGVETYGGLMDIIIPRNSSIPCSYSKEFTNFLDGQSAMSIHVLQGERDAVDECRSLGKFNLVDLPPMLSGTARIEVNFQIDADGLLSVSAIEKSKGVKSSIEVLPSYGLSSKEVEEMILTSHENSESDKNYRALQESLVEAERVLIAIKSAMEIDKKLLSDDMKSNINQAIDNLKNNMKKKDVGEVKKAIMNLEKKSEEFIEKRMNSSLDEIIKGKKIEDIDNA